MKCCVIGAGPSGIFAAKYLQEAGIATVVFEKENEIGGNYRYATIRNSYLQDLAREHNIKIKTNCTADSFKKDNCDFYINASGGVPRPLNIPGAQHALDAMELIKRHYKGNELPPLGDVCILGMGNVSMDLIKYIYQKSKSITVLSRSGLLDAAFDNFLFREIADTFKDDLRINHADETPKTRIDETRLKILRNVQPLPSKDSHGGLIDKSKKLNLIFNAVPLSIQKSKKLGLTMSVQNVLQNEYFDTIIKSVGFIPNKIDIPINKPVYSTGWSVQAHGNIASAMADAKSTVDRIMDDKKANFKTSV
ncbi:hypothetical protein ENBRE01_0824 [Enteropsectra breve]|nr:hypothetical protein ENBRE01_0824 [Enteropsectra breve]